MYVIFMISCRVFWVILLFVRNFVGGSLVSQFANAIKDLNIDRVNELAAKSPGLLTKFDTEVWHNQLIAFSLQLCEDDESGWDMESSVPHFQSLNHLCLFMTRDMKDPNEIVMRTTPLCMAIICSSIEVALELLRRPEVSIDQQDAPGWTAIMYAWRFKLISLVRRLLERGVDLEVTDKYGYTALNYACLLSPSNIRGLIIDLILAADASVRTHPPYKLLHLSRRIDWTIARRVKANPHELYLQRASMFLFIMILFACSYGECQNLST